MPFPIRVAALVACTAVPLWAQNPATPSDPPTSGAASAIAGQGTPSPAHRPDSGRQSVPATVPVPSPAANAAKLSEPPGAVYRDALRPLDAVRASLENWSDSELGALAVGIHRAQAACALAKPFDYSGDDLYDLAHLCSFGQSWPAAEAAANAYIASGAETYRAQAYALKISSQVHENEADTAFKTAEEMLRALPYDAEVAYALHYLEDDLDKAWNPLALTLASEEHAPLVKALQQGTALKALHSAAVISIGGLFESGMKLASMQRYLGNDGAAELTVAELRQAVSGLAALPQRDAADVASANLRYELLDRPLPAFSARNALPSTGTGIAALRNGFGKATVFVLFPDWCVHCRKMMKTLAAFTAANAKVPVYAYGLEFHEEPADGLKPPSARALEELRGTPILRVNASVAAEWGASDFPFGVVTDGEGIIRFAGAIPADGFKGDGYVQRVIERMYSTPEPEMQGMER